MGKGNEAKTKAALEAKREIIHVGIKIKKPSAGRLLQ